MPTPLRRTLMFVGLTVVAMLVVWGLGVVVRQSLERKFDLANKPPAEAFTLIFRMPVPNGVSNLKVAGEASLSGYFWMRFHAEDLDTVLNALQKNPVLSMQKSAMTLAELAPLRQDASMKARYTIVGWEKAFRIPKPECHEFASIPFGTGWTGVVVVDRQNSLIYARGILL